MPNDFLKLAARIDPRRGGACFYCNDDFRQALAAWVYFDSEMWLVHARAKEPMMAQIRLQFWADFIDDFANKSVFDEISAAIFYLINGGYLTADDFNSHLDSHFDKIGQDSAKASIEIFQCYFKNAAKICGINTQFDDAASIIVNAINGDFKDNPKHITNLNKIIRQLKPAGKSAAIDILLFLRLCRNPKIYHDIIDTEPKKIGFIANMHLFWGRAISRL